MGQRIRRSAEGDPFRGSLLLYSRKAHLSNHLFLHRNPPGGLAEREEKRYTVRSVIYVVIFRFRAKTAFKSQEGVMKKILSILLAALMLSSVCILAFAAENDQKMTTSDEQWWDWFNSLSEEEQACIRFRPGSDAKAENENLPSETAAPQSNGISSAAVSLLPTGGGKPACFTQERGARR